MGRRNSLYHNKNYDNIQALYCVMIKGGKPIVSHGQLFFFFVQVVLQSRIIRNRLYLLVFKLYVIRNIWEK
jgi:hypothetical protein